MEELTPPRREDSECDRDIITPFLYCHHFPRIISLLLRKKQNGRNISYYSMHTPHDLLRICYVKGKNSLIPNPKSFRPSPRIRCPRHAARSSDSNPPPISLLLRKGNMRASKTSCKKSHLPSKCSAKSVLWTGNPRFTHQDRTARRERFLP